MLLAKVTAQSLPFSAHYLVGLGEDDAADPKFGFYQCVDIDDIAMAGASSKLGDVAANLVCVSVYVLDSGGYTDYQYATVSSILSTVRKITGNPGIMLYGSDSVIPPIPGGKPFDAGKVSK
jgi:N-acetyl-anhydromuramyl-L-alanine amidase AmpD